jgi:hypothetical protein
LSITFTGLDKHTSKLYGTIIKCVASFQLSLLLKNYLQRTQTLQLNEIGSYLQK